MIEKAIFHVEMSSKLWIVGGKPKNPDIWRIPGQHLLLAWIETEKNSDVCI